MKRWQKAVCFSGLALVVLSVVHTLPMEFPLKEYVTHLVPHLLIIVSAVIVGAVLMHIIDESIHENLMPVMKDGFQGIANSFNVAIQGLVNGLERNLQAGFRTVAASVASEVHQFPEAWKNLSDESVLIDLRSAIKTPEVKELLIAGRIGEAVAKLDLRDRTKREEEIAVLLLSEEEKDWLKAFEIQKTYDVQNPKSFLTLAYRLWSIEKLEQAIEIAEKGLSLALQKDPSLVPKFKNSLAYYYAESGKPEHENFAREYSSLSRSARPNEAGPLDTEGYVKITYGKTAEEVIEGVELCGHARRLGIPFAAYARHVTRANQRLNTLQT